jgi:hypothetical protein
MPNAECQTTNAKLKNNSSIISLARKTPILNSKHQTPSTKHQTQKRIKHIKQATNKQAQSVAIIKTSHAKL